MHLPAALRRIPGHSSRILLVATTCLLLGCASCQENPQGTRLHSSPPDPLADGWDVSSLAQEQLDPGSLAALEQSLGAGEFAPPDALLIARNGRLIYEQYWNGFGPLRRHDLRSATKSITSLLIGQAVDQGLIADLQAPVVGFFPEYKALTSRDPRLGRITLSHLLTMSSALDCDDWNPASPGQEDKMYQSADWLRFVLGLPMVGEPGSVTTYCTGGAELLGGVLARTAVLPVPVYAQRQLFLPLQIEEAQWSPAPPDGTDTAGHLALRPRDLLKLGQLVLDGGRWHGVQVVPAAWVAASTAPLVHLGDSQYGQLWWRNTFRVNGIPFDAIFARGNGGQYLFIFPQQRLTVLFMGSHYNSAIGNDQPPALCGRFILPAIKAP